MTANPPHPSVPGDNRPVDSAEIDDNPLSGGTHGILAVTLATLGLALVGAGIAAIVSWLV